MSFFEPPPPPPEPPRRSPHPEWAGPPDNVRPAPFELAETLVRTGNVFIHVFAGLAYPKGFEFSLQLLRREARHAHDDNPMHYWHGRHGGELTPQMLRFGIQDAEGGKATIFGRHYPPRDGPPDGPILRPGGSSGSPNRYDTSFWVWPIPPAGLFAFVVEWPAEGIELTRVEIDSEPIREAAARAEMLWPDPPSAGAWTSSIGHMRSSS